MIDKRIQMGTPNMELQDCGKHKGIRTLVGKFWRVACEGEGLQGLGLQGFAGIWHQVCSRRQSLALRMQLFNGSKAPLLNLAKRGNLHRINPPKPLHTPKP